MTTSSDDATLPLLAVVYGSLSLEQPLRRLMEASEGLCRILWILPFGDRTARSALRVKHVQGEVTGDVVDVSTMTAAEAADAVRAHRPDGITCFIDETIVWTAALAARLGLGFHRLETAVALTDKFEQRRALAAAGLRTPPFRRVEELVDEHAVADLLRETGLPVVLKPRRGVAGRDSEPLRSAADVRHAASVAAPDSMLIEGYIPDPTTPVVGIGSAPFVSVELAVDDGVVDALGVTGRTPLAAPFRETGQIFPADVDEHTRSSLIRAGIAAVEALGVTRGVLHVEIKCTDDGPVIIEVNGRPGGGMVREFITSSTGEDPLRLSMSLALGTDTEVGSIGARGHERLHTRDVGFVFWIQPDRSFTRVTAIEGLEEAAAIPGVRRVAPGLEVGASFSWRSGYLGFAAEVSGEADDFAHVQRIREQVLSTITVTGEREGDDGRG